jgi:hypothetical protein
MVYQPCHHVGEVAAIYCPSLPKRCRSLSENQSWYSADVLLSLFALMKDNTVRQRSQSTPWVLQPNFGNQSTWRDHNEPRSSLVTRPMLDERHVNMMAFSQCIGIGLFLQSG